MPTAKVTFFVRGKLNGWTETYRRGVTTLRDLVTVTAPSSVAGVVTNVPSAGTPLGDLMLARRNLSPSDISFIRVRASLEGSPRNVAIYWWTNDGSPASGSYSVPTSVQRSPTQAVYAVEDWTALLIDLTGVIPAQAGGFQYQGRLYLHGLPEDCLSPEETYAPRGSAIYSSLPTFMNLLMNGGWLFEGRNRLNTPNAPNPVPITTFTIDPSGLTAAVAPIPLLPNLVIGGPPLQPTPGIPFYVAIRGRRYSEWNGVHRAVWAGGTAPTVTLGPTRRPLREPSAVPAAVAGTVQVLLLQQIPIQDWHTDRFVEHRIGRPFGALVGRRRAR